jgi:hypothetical protein
MKTTHHRNFQNYILYSIYLTFDFTLKSMRRAYRIQISFKAIIFSNKSLGEKLHTLSPIFVCLFVCFESHEQCFSYLATVTITGDRAANLDLSLALTAFSSEGSFTYHTYCDTGPPFLRSHLKDQQRPRPKS